MKFIENKINNFSKPYVAPRIRIVGVEEECGLLAGGSLDGDVPGPETDPGSDGDGFAKQSHRIFDDSDSE